MVHKTLPMNEIYPVLREVIDCGGEFQLVTAGTSMLPLLRDRKDTVILVKPSKPLKKYDVVLYKRNDGAFVLHRIVAFDNKGGFVMCGDNQYIYEYGIKNEDIIAIMKGYIKNDKKTLCSDMSFKIYSVFHCKKRTVRLFLGKIKRAIKAAIFKNK